MRALMVDVDGVLLVSPGGRPWSWNLAADLGLDTAGRGACHPPPFTRG